MTRIVLCRGMNVEDAMTPREELVTVELPGTRDDALEYLKTRRFSSVPVVKETDDGEVFRGLVSRERLIEQPDEDQLAMLVEDAPAIGSDASVEELAALMRETGARRVPVVDDRLAGIVTITDVIHAIATGELGTDTDVAEIATRDINTTYEGTPLRVVEREISYGGVPYAVVLDDSGEPAGMVTEVDIIDVAEIVDGEMETGNSFADQDNEWMWEGIKGVGSRTISTRNVEFPSGPASEFMTADLVTVSARKTVRDAAQLMITNDIEQVPMVSGDELAGIVRDMDLLEALSAPEER